MTAAGHPAASDEAESLLRHPATVSILFLLSGMRGGISPGRAGLTPHKAQRLADAGLLDLYEWRPRSGGRIPRRWTAVASNETTMRLTSLLADGFRHANFMTPPSGVDGLYLLPRRRLALDVRNRPEEWRRTVGAALAALGRPDPYRTDDTTSGTGFD